jgi:hypothetical protein
VDPWQKPRPLGIFNELKLQGHNQLKSAEAKSQQFATMQGAPKPPKTALSEHVHTSSAD